MNLNNLEELKDEVKRLGFSDKVAEQMENHMKAGALEFKLHDSLAADKGQIDFNLHFKKSGKSDFYYFNKYEVGHNKGKVLGKDEHYLITSPGEKAGEKDVQIWMGSTAEAIATFRNEEGDAQLLVAKGGNEKEQLASAVVLASMEKGTVNFIEPSFKQTFYTTVPVQTFWVEQGKGFTAEQAANLVQGRAVYRDDLLSLNGVAFKAWKELDLDKERDKHGNLSFNMYSDQYGFDLKAEVEKFAIKELSDPAKMEKLYADLRDGNRVSVTVEREGKEEKVKMEPSVRYLKLNFFDGKGKMEKREQFLKEPTVAQSVASSRYSKHEVGESQGIRM
jgi:hypothetical protein